jgi:hypothetical protein
VAWSRGSRNHHIERLRARENRGRNAQIRRAVLVATDMQGRLWCANCRRECATRADYEVCERSDGQFELLCLGCYDDIRPTA